MPALDRRRKPVSRPTPASRPDPPRGPASRPVVEAEAGAAEIETVASAAEIDAEIPRRDEAGTR